MLQHMQPLCCNKYEWLQNKKSKLKNLWSVTLFVKLVVLYFQKHNLDRKVIDANLRVKTF